MRLPEDGLRKAGALLDEAEARQFWQLAGDVALRRELLPGQTESIDLADLGPSQTWLVFALPEGRTVQLVYAAATGVVFDAGQTELYPVPQGWLQPLFGDAALPGAEFALGPAQVEQQPGRGSPLWWVVMIGGGLAAIAFAIWLRRDSLARR